VIDWTLILGVYVRGYFVDQILVEEKNMPSQPGAAAYYVDQRVRFKNVWI
jgi:hypothetical protein